MTFADIEAHQQWDRGAKTSRRKSASTPKDCHCWSWVLWIQSTGGDNLRPPNRLLLTNLSSSLSTHQNLSTVQTNHHTLTQCWEVSCVDDWLLLATKIHLCPAIACLRSSLYSPMAMAVQMMRFLWILRFHFTAPRLFCIIVIVIMTSCATRVWHYPAIPFLLVTILTPLQIAILDWPMLLQLRWHYCLSDFTQ